MPYKSIYVLGLCLMALFGWTGLSAQNAAKGQELFLQKCASCHATDMKTKLTGPALAGVGSKWDTKENLYEWIRNSQRMINEVKHPRAVELWNEWSPTIMNAFPELKNGDIDDILLYIDNMATAGCAEPPCAVATAAVAGAEGGAKADTGMGYLLWILLFVLLAAVGLLGLYVNDLSRLAQARMGQEVGEKKSLLQILLNPTVVKLFIFGLVLFGGYTTVNTAIGLGRQQGYAPEQPIKFSHALHAGKNGIDCQYCHDGARRSKHGLIPAMNTCMNCHAVVNKGPQYGTAEILKIYASTGYNPAANGVVYFGEEDSPEARLKVYEEWLYSMADEADVKAQPKRVEAEIKKQLEVIKPMIGKTVEWVRIHNLPDHAYFNHAQHVTVGKIACQTCHGKVENMEVLQQHAPLSMGWCINCHRQTEVKFTDNPYYAGKNAEGEVNYAHFEKYYKELEARKRSGVTVEDIGGLECQKCHY